jgi:hypothetical protein
MTNSSQRPCERFDKKLCRREQRRTAPVSGTRRPGASISVDRVVQPSLQAPCWWGRWGGVSGDPRGSSRGDSPLPGRVSSWPRCLRLFGKPVQTGDRAREHPIRSRPIVSTASRRGWSRRITPVLERRACSNRQQDSERLPGVHDVDLDPAGRESSPPPPLLRASGGVRSPRPLPVPRLGD